MSICSTPLVIREKQIKTTTSVYYFTITRMVIIKKKENKEYCPGYKEIGASGHSWWECKTVWWFLKKLNIELEYAILLPGI